MKKNLLKSTAKTFKKKQVIDVNDESVKSADETEEKVTEDNSTIDKKEV